MTNGREFSKPARYEITVKGTSRTTVVGVVRRLDRGPAHRRRNHAHRLVADQPALHGLLAKVRDLGLPLLSVIRVEEDEL